MERLTIDEVIEHCKRTTAKYENLNGVNMLETADISFSLVKEYWEHRQVKEYLEELKRYRDLEEQGLLLRLPCKVGDTIYRVNAGAKEPVIKMRVLQVKYKQLHKDIIIIRIDAINDNDMGESCYLLEDFGKTVFLTQAEAEQKLKEMERD